MSARPSDPSSSISSISLQSPTRYRPAKESASTTLNDQEGPSSIEVPDDQATTPSNAQTRHRATTHKPVSTANGLSSSRDNIPSKRSHQPAMRNLPGIPKAATTSLYYTSLPCHGMLPEQALRAHTGTVVEDKIWFIGGVNAKNCWRDVAYLDTENLQWTTVETAGDPLPPLRAHTTTLVGDKLYIFGGGDGPTYSNEVWLFDTVTYRFSRPNIASSRHTIPPPRRAHTTILYRNFLVVFGGGNGQAALNDVWALDVSDPNRLTWQEWQTTGDRPQRKGYHTANLVGDKMIVFGGSDGHASFADVHILNLKSLHWTLISTELKFNRLSHTSTQVGSYLIILGGHNGQTYAQDILLFNLVTLQWEMKTPRGQPPPGRGYHVALLHDARIFISGGYNGVAVFDDVWALELGASAYLPQVTTFEVNPEAEGVTA